MRGRGHDGLLRVFRASFELARVDGLDSVLFNDNVRVARDHVQELHEPAGGRRQVQELSGCIFGATSEVCHKPQGKLFNFRENSVEFGEIHVLMPSGKGRKAEIRDDLVRRGGNIKVKRNIC